MSWLNLFKNKAEMRGIVETQVPRYKGFMPDHTNHTPQIMELLRRDSNPVPYKTFSEASKGNPQYAIRISMEKAIEGTAHPTFRLLGGESYNPEHEVLINLVGGELGDKKVEQVNEDTMDGILEYTNEYLEAKFKQEKSILPENNQELQEEEPSTESEPKSNY